MSKYESHILDCFCDDNLSFDDLYLKVEYREWEADGSTFKTVITSCEIKVESGASQEMIEVEVGNELGISPEDIIQVNY